MAYPTVDAVAIGPDGRFLGNQRLTCRKGRGPNRRTCTEEEALAAYERSVQNSRGRDARVVRADSPEGARALREHRIWLDGLDRGPDIPGL